MPKRSRLLSPIIAALLILSGCSPSTDDGTDDASTAPPSSGPGAVPEGPADWRPIAPDGVLLLNEVGFRPPPGDGGFVEILNPGSVRIDPTGFVLRTGGGEQFTIPTGTSPVPPGGLLVVWFGASDPSGGITGDPSDLVTGENGSLVLSDAAGEVQDRVAWGDGGFAAVSLGASGVLPEPVAGATIGRVPFDGATGPASWSFHAPSEATPGAPNPSPVAGLLLPVTGAELAGPAHLTWYPAPGAQGYRIQVATDTGFADPIVDEHADEIGFVLDQPPGTYYWRIETLGADDRSVGLSPIQEITIVEPPSAWGDTASLPTGAVEVSARRQAVRTDLGIPLIAQHKDTPMLDPQSLRQSGAHAWNAGHAGFDPGDPSDNMNCALASTAMVNAFYGGSLSQDRIGYEVLNGIGAGPETDLNWGRGLFASEITRALSFALGGAASAHRPQGDSEATWRLVTTEIDAGRPLVTAFLHATGGHAMVVSGYEVKADGSRYLLLNDPWGPARYAAPLQPGAASSMGGGAAATIEYLWTVPAAVATVDDEPEIALDSDGDGVSDFDEARRFGTNPTGVDSDYDGIGDFEEIEATVFDPTHGIAATRSLDGRDVDTDGMPMELDDDADDGGCLDGLEDTDRDGVYAAGSETYNFDKDDDTCFDLQVTLTASTESIEYEFEYWASFLVEPDGTLIGAGNGFVYVDDSDADCVDVDAGRIRKIEMTVAGPFAFDVGGEYRTGGTAAGRVPQPEDPSPELAIMFPLDTPSFEVSLSDCEIQDNALVNEILAVYLGNIGWATGDYTGAITIPYPITSPTDHAFEIDSPMLPGWSGEITTTITRVEPGT